MTAPIPSYRHEAFAEAVASGMSASKAYSFAYARPRNGDTRASAARLLTDANVRQRVAELRTEAAAAAQASLSLLIPVLEKRARAAISAGQLTEAFGIIERLAEIAAEVNPQKSPPVDELT